jgi:hypothetical protein
MCKLVAHLGHGSVITALVLVVLFFSQNYNRDFEFYTP